MDEILGDRPTSKPESLHKSGVRAADRKEKSGSFDYDLDCDECEEINIGKSQEKEICCSMAEPLDSTPSSISSSSSSAKTPDDSIMKKTTGSKEVFTCFSKHGKSKKRSRSELFLSLALETITKQQELADARFCKMKKEGFRNSLK